MACSPLITKTSNSIPQTPIATQTTYIKVELQIKSIMVDPFIYDIWDIKWGINGILSTAAYTEIDLVANNFQGPGYRVHWRKKIQAMSGDEIKFVVTGTFAAECLIIVDGVKMISDSLVETGTAKCKYTIP